MKNSDHIPPQSFREIAKDVFAFLISDFGFSVSNQNSEYFIAYERQDCQVGIYDEWGEIIVGIRPLLPSPLAVLKARYGFNLAQIMSCLNPKSKSEFEDYRFQPYAYQSKAKWWAMMLKQHCTPILAGDLSVWSRIEPCIAEDWRRWEKEWENDEVQNKKDSEERRIDRLKAQAQIAWQNKEYVKFIELLEPEITNLTETDKKKLVYAWKQFAGH